jgi:hypothetical protein
MDAEQVGSSGVRRKRFRILKVFWVAIHTSGSFCDVMFGGWVYHESFIQRKESDCFSNNYNISAWHVAMWED